MFTLLFLDEIFLSSMPAVSSFSISINNLITKVIIIL